MEAVRSEVNGLLLAQGDDVTKAEWYAMLDGGQIFGPTSLQDLYDWAADCRLGPGHRVSRDRQTWEPVEHVAALGIEWMVTLADGSAYGPLNIFAIRQLGADGVLAAGQPITHSRDGRKGTWEELALVEARRLRAEAARPTDDLRKLTAAMRDIIAHLQRVENHCRL